MEMREENEQEHEHDMVDASSYSISSPARPSRCPFHLSLNSFDKRSLILSVRHRSRPAFRMGDLGDGP